MVNLYLYRIQICHSCDEKFLEARPAIKRIRVKNNFYKFNHIHFSIYYSMYNSKNNTWSKYIKKSHLFLLRTFEIKS